MAKFVDCGGYIGGKCSACNEEGSGRYLEVGYVRLCNDCLTETVEELLVEDERVKIKKALEERKIGWR